MRVEADGTVDVTVTVNGRAVTLAVAPRTTLSDVLRDRLGLTGTHVGCEHGVCGMCTVLLDGEAVRACLLFAVQCDGASLTTVEGLGSADDQHPLQQAFSHHHALQCGFCTPGMLMSSYDLLAGGTYSPDTLPEDMSGVLCRCTGYRGHPRRGRRRRGDPPRRRPATPRRRAAGARRAHSGTSAAWRRRHPVSVAPRRRPRRSRSRSGTPTATVSVRSELASGVDDVWAVLADFDRLAACLPGAEMTADLGDDRYRGRATVGLGPVSLRFEGLAHVVEHDPSARRMRVLAQGTDRGGSSTQAVIRLAADPAEGGGTVLWADADVHLSGRVAQFGRALAGDVSRRLFEQFAEAVDEAARTGEAPTTRTQPAAARPRRPARPDPPSGSAPPVARRARTIVTAGGRCRARS